ncbi:MAG: aminoglycoside phosphotransferase family protein [Hamadaea sp.]|uniref:aminoglycoside phosphotransferase family protein n=1 Tax=Hamadaea sp. TaxID=2024425 RepID=UPI0017B00A01|nr:aminoglycoside phosphotransferase family protein [Hamadaea sp.]NUR73777.1 aminoglycoside phosphotransferase family protein [Hamadaea sp.]NUT18196.1 aminoglycoside phosphotransferase family protein [Hamadaea sp.]
MIYPDVRPDITPDLVRHLVSTQFPHWAGLPVRPVAVDGWDNRTYHLGDRMTVRLPSGPWYARQVAKEQEWLPKLAASVPLPIPVPLGHGRPDEAYPFPWSIYGWIDGDLARPDRVRDLTEFAVDVAEFLVALAKADTTGAPGPGEHNFFRGGPLTTYHDETVEAIAKLGDAVPGDFCRRIWQEGLDATWDGRPVWFHGDISPNNLLVRDGRLAAVIDFGTSGVGDPACDLAIAWGMFTGSSRAAYREALGVDDGTWARGRGWALWKALIVYADSRGTGSPREDESHHALTELLTE